MVAGANGLDITATATSTWTSAGITRPDAGRPAAGTTCSARWAAAPPARAARGRRRAGRGRGRRHAPARRPRRVGSRARLVGGPGSDLDRGIGGRSSVLDYSGATAAIRLDLRTGVGHGTGHRPPARRPGRDRLALRRQARGRAGAAFLVRAGRATTCSWRARAAARFDGGPGRDTVSYGQAAPGVRVSLATMHAGGDPRAWRGSRPMIGSRQRDVLIGDGRATCWTAAGRRRPHTGGAGADTSQRRAGRRPAGRGHRVRTGCRQGPGPGRDAELRGLRTALSAGARRPRRA